jgi:5-formyltetrahydrofolate cyclo-ligase
MAKPSKTELRKQTLERRNEIDSVIRARDSAIIRQRLFQHPRWQDANTFLTYVSFGSEVETHKLIQEALDFGKRVVVPIVDKTTQELQLSELKRLGDLAPGAIPGVYEPAIPWRTRVDPTEIEVVLVPGVVFDRSGGRIGMGGGFFDKLLTRMPNATRMALCFSLQVKNHKLPLEPHDMPVHYLFTEQEVIDTGLASPSTLR